MKIKKCPFCGSEAPGVNPDAPYIHPNTGEKIDTKQFNVFCPNCGARGGRGKTGLEAVLIWNMRNGKGQVMELFKGVEDGN